MTTQRYGRMVHDYYTQRIDAVVTEREERLKGLKTRADAEAYVRDVRKKVRKSFAPFPKRTPLNARVTRRHVLPDVVIENVLFESRPEFLVSGNMYLPRDMKPGEKRPAVLGLCGHTWEGKAYNLYQYFARGLARRGFVVFVIDPISQGERRQFFPNDGGPRPPLCVAHNLMGNQMVLVDDFFGTWRVWDAIRSLDYLLSRPEVDRTRVGATGNSGGGTLTAYLAALDSRLTMAAPGCYICSWLANMRNEIPSDAEQAPPGILAAGLDEADLLLCHAPLPTLILSQVDDFFDERYARRAAAEVHRVHALLGSHDSSEYFMGPRGHGFFQENREAMYAFFMKHAGVQGSPKEKSSALLEARTLNAARRGSTRSEGSRRAFEFTADRAKQLARERSTLSVSPLRKVAARLLAMPRSGAMPDYRVSVTAGPEPAGSTMRAQFALETEPGVEAIATIYGPPYPGIRLPTGKVTLYVGHTSSQDDVGSVPAIKALTLGRSVLVAVDPRGMGQSMPNTCGVKDFHHPYGSDYLYATAGEMLGESYLGRRVFDVMRMMDLLLAEGATEVRLLGRGLGSVIVTFAGLLHDTQPRVKLMHYLPSFELVATTPLSSWPLSSLLRGCLCHFDLPDIYRALGKRLSKTMPWNAHMRPVR